MPAECRQAGDDRVAGLDRAHLVADRLDDPRRLMPRDRGQRGRIRAIDEMQVGAAHPARGGADQDFVRGRLGDVDIADFERLDLLEQDGSFHNSILQTTVRPELVEGRVSHTCFDKLETNGVSLPAYPDVAA